MIQTMTITRTMRDAKARAFRNMLCREDFIRKCEKLESVKPSARVSLLAEICGMFETLGIPCERGRENAYYRELAETSDLPAFHDVERRILDAMYDCFEDYPTPTRYMQRIVDRLSDAADGWNADPLRLRILKQFIKYGSCLCYETEELDDAGNPILDAKGKPKKKMVYIYNGKPYLKSYVKAKIGKSVRSDEQLLEYLEDDVFDVLKTATKEQRRSSGKYGILRMADDLAAGRFKASGATKRELYLFAYVFDMTFYHEGQKGTDVLLDYNSDIEKNLFEDYYTNNLMRWLTTAYEGRLSAFELDPSGQGINYKNFAEMIYLYFLVQEGTPIDRLRQATEMIERLKVQAEGTGSRQSEPVRQDETAYFRDLYTEEILAMPVEEFEAFIAENYDCDVVCVENDEEGKAVIYKKGEFQLANSQRTAFEHYRDMLDAIGLEYKEYGIQNCNYGLWFTDVSMDEKTNGEFLQDFAEGKDPEKAARLMQLLRAINMFLGVTRKESVSGSNENQEYKEVSRQYTKALSVQAPEDMTRTALITAYYYYYNTIHENKGREKSFIEVYDAYMDSRVGLNYYLQEAHYQPLGERNIFDLAVIFSSYAYLQN